MTRISALATAAEYRAEARRTKQFPLVSAGFYALARKYLRKARDLRNPIQLPHRGHEHAYPQVE